MQAVPLYAKGNKKSSDKQVLQLFFGPLTQAQLTAHSDVDVVRSLTDPVTYPLTFCTPRWDFELNANGAAIVNWAIVVRRGGNPNVTINPPGGSVADALVDGISASDILVFGTMSFNTYAAGSSRSEGSSKTMRKLNKGDEVILLINGTVAGVDATLTVAGTIQFWQKS